MAKYAMVGPSLLPMMIYPTEILIWTGKLMKFHQPKVSKVVVLAAK